MTMALHHMLQTRGSKVKSLCAEPGVAKTDLNPNLIKGHAQSGKQVHVGPDASAMFPGIQSAADGACPLIVASFSSDVASGDFFMPGELVKETVVGWPVKCISACRATPTTEWMSKNFENEKLTLDPANHELLWDASVKAVGKWLAPTARL